MVFSFLIFLHQVIFYTRLKSPSNTQCPNSKVDSLFKTLLKKLRSLLLESSLTLLALLRSKHCSQRITNTITNLKLGSHEERPGLVQCQLIIQFTLLFNSPTLAPSPECANIPSVLNVQKPLVANYQLHNYTSTFSSYIIIIITLLTMTLLDIVPGWI